MMMMMATAVCNVLVVVCVSSGVPSCSKERERRTAVWKRYHLNGQVGEWLPRQPQWQHCGELRFTQASRSAES
jgi:hypothetical protein